MRGASLVGVVLSVLALLVGSAEAKGRGQGGVPAGCWGMGQGPGAPPQISPELRLKLAKEHASFLEATLELRANLLRKTQSLLEMLADTKAKDDDILKLHQEIQSLRMQIAQKRFQHMLKLRGELPPEALVGGAGRLFMGRGMCCPSMGCGPWWGMMDD